MGYSKSPLGTSLGPKVASQEPQMTTMKPEIISPEPQMVPLRAQKVPNHLFADQNTPPEIPIDLSGISNNLPLSLNDIPEDCRVVIEAPRDLDGAQK